jgi:serine-type D-Ala-D-Ala endopeptidase (penicillin-binding protein 7)
MKILILSLVMLFSVDVSAATHYVYNYSKKEIVVDDGSDKVRPIASVTKLMTALVILESGISLDEKVPYGGFKNIPAKPRTRDELLSLLLIKSDNNAAEALARSFPGGRDVFIKSMNATAMLLGMSYTTYDDPSGLSVHNQSTAKDLTKLLHYASNYAKIKQIASSTSYTLAEKAIVRVSTKKSKRDKSKKTYSSYRVITLNNTNYYLLNQYEEIEISKTGYTNPAGKCLTMYVTKNGEHYAVVILGERNMRDVERVSRRIIDSL